MRDTLNELQIAIEHETCRVIALRFTLENERRNRMAIEIKGLKADALTARANLDKLRAAYAKFNEAAPAHAADVDKLASDITGMQSDLEFAATVMGNSAGESEKLAQERSEKQTITTADTAKIAPEPIVGQQTAMSPAGSLASKVIIDSLTASIPAVADRVALGPHPDQPEAGFAGIVDADKIRDQVNKAAESDIAEVAEGPVATFRAAE